MNWISNFVRPKIQALVSNKKDVPDNLWDKCPSCEGMLFHRDLAESGNVCYHCGHHLAISIYERCQGLFDDGAYKRIAVPKVAVDPLKFRDKKRYADRYRDSQAKTGEQDAILVAHGKIGSCDSVIAGFDFRFMGGSMGMAVGEGIVTAAREAVKRKAALIVIPASGGARMQEGALSLMQMPRTIIAVDMVKEAGLPYIVLLTNPTTGGVSASFAMVGDIHIAEPGAMIGFAGRRVIEETIREELPDGFQTAEYLLEHGMVDMVLPRKDHNKVIGSTLSMLMDRPAPEKPKNNKKKGKTESKSSAGKKASKRAVDNGVKAVRKASSLAPLKPANEETAQISPSKTNEAVAAE